MHLELLAGRDDVLLEIRGKRGPLLLYAGKRVHRVREKHFEHGDRYPLRAWAHSMSEQMHAPAKPSILSAVSRRSAVAAHPSERPPTVANRSKSRYYHLAQPPDTDLSTEDIRIPKCDEHQ